MARKRRRKSFGVLYHRGASGARVGRGEREFSVRVHLYRNIGASTARQFCASAYIPKSGRGRRKLGFRQSDRACASTPTVAAKRALRLFIGKSWT